jgi:hypothetical protein
MVGAMIRGSFNPAAFDQEEEAAAKVAGENESRNSVDETGLLMEARPSRKPLESTMEGVASMRRHFTSTQLRDSFSPVTLVASSSS